MTQEESPLLMLVQPWVSWSSWDHAFIWDSVPSHPPRVWIPVFIIHPLSNSLQDSLHPIFSGMSVLRPAAHLLIAYLYAHMHLYRHVSWTRHTVLQYRRALLKSTACPIGHLTDNWYSLLAPFLHLPTIHLLNVYAVPVLMLMEVHKCSHFILVPSLGSWVYY